MNDEKTLMKSANDVINNVEERKVQRAQDSNNILKLFLDEEGKLFPFQDSVDAVVDIKYWERQRAIEAVVGLADDTLDPVQVVRDDRAFVGIVDYVPFENHGGYGFTEYDDTFGKRKNLVCSRCVDKYKYASQPFRAVEGVGRHEIGVSYQSMLQHLESHYQENHDVMPEDVSVGASLVSGTTIDGNTAIHGGNQGSFAVTDFGVGTVSDGEFVQNSGWSLVGGSAGGSVEAAENDDLSDLTLFTSKTDGNTTDTIVDLTSTSGTCLGGMIQQATEDTWQLEITVDGATTQTFDNLSSSVDLSYVVVPFISFDTSLDITANAGGNTTSRIAYIWVK